MVRFVGNQELHRAAGCDSGVPGSRHGTLGGVRARHRRFDQRGDQVGHQRLARVGPLVLPVQHLHRGHLGSGRSGNHHCAGFEYPAPIRGYGRGTDRPGQGLLFPGPGRPTAEGTPHRRLRPRRVRPALPLSGPVVLRRLHSGRPGARQFPAAGPDRRSIQIRLQPHQQSLGDDPPELHPQRDRQLYRLRRQPDLRAGPGGIQLRELRQRRLGRGSIDHVIAGERERQRISILLLAGSPAPPGTGSRTGDRHHRHGQLRPDLLSSHRQPAQALPGHRQFQPHLRKT